MVLLIFDSSIAFFSQLLFIRKWGSWERAGEERNAGTMYARLGMPTNTAVYVRQIKTSSLGEAAIVCLGQPENKLH